MSFQFLSAIQARRTHYGLSRSSTVSDARLRSIVETAVKHAPSPFNCQSARVVLLLGNESDLLWDIVMTGFLRTLGDNEAAIQFSTKKISQYTAGYGTILFFEDLAAVNAISAKVPDLAPHLPVWSENSTGMLQFIIWTALAAEGMGASLQHHGAYSAEIDANIKKEWKLPSTWKSTAMMPFGIPTGEPGVATRPKTSIPIEERMKVFE